MGKGILEMPSATVIITVNTTWSAALISRKPALWSFPVKVAASSPLHEGGSVTVTQIVRSMASAVPIMRIFVEEVSIMGLITASQYTDLSTYLSFADHV